MKGNHMTSQTDPTAAGIRLFSLEDLLQSSTCLQAPMGHRVVSLQLPGAPAMLAAVSMSRPSCVATANMGGKNHCTGVLGKSSHGSQHITDLQQEIHTHRSWHRHHQTSDPTKSEKEDTHTTKNILYVCIYI